MTQHYIGTKQIVAWPTPRIIRNEDESDGPGLCEPGYSVQYPDGYTRWSSKAVFEAAYLPMGHVGHLLPHQQRVVGERVQLLDKLTKLREFVSREDAQEMVGADELGRLEYQLDLMTAYDHVLEARIAAFPQPEQTYLQPHQGLEPVEYFENADIAKLTNAERIGMFGYDPIEPEQPSTPVSQEPQCRGSWALGSACKRCQRCLDTKPTENQ